MAKRVVIAVALREYAAKLAEYLREEQPDWDIAVFTHVDALRRELRTGGGVDLILTHLDFLEQLEEMKEDHRVRKIIVLMEEIREGVKWQQVAQYQPLPHILSSIKEAVNPANTPNKGCTILPIFSASGGVGKTTIALNLIRQLSERGLRTLYLNLEALNATSLLFGRGEPDSLSRLLYQLQNHPEQGLEQLEPYCRHHSYLRTDFIDAPDHPGERLALTPELLSDLLDAIRKTGRYDFIVLDPDSGASNWHRCLIEKSDRVVWVTVDDIQALKKADKLLSYWKEQIAEEMSKVLFILNKGYGSVMANSWELPGTQPSLILPYIPQWKALDLPSRLLGVPAFAGAVERLVDELTRGEDQPSSKGRQEGNENGIHRTHIRGAG